ncbi:uracil-DNA glycosylase [Dethiobacter alkaliphilus]|uniref:uracil-DNA glycosylase n=1 Tax=Dethiobacter alkaliphilus TaxID=427926 RepID=UPI002226C4C5|nr:uracil-DNA glycosylase [Dethiobacter alkaliphilus]MCW3489000.1 uracil-DNA glycosylase [Dethiobacter alkaliphilus]
MVNNMRERILFDLLVPGSEKKRLQKPAKVFAPLPAVEQPQTIAALSKDVLDCAQCGLRSQATQVVFGEGNPDADLLFVGEAPGAEEDAQGRPFVGEAGKLLNKILAAAEISREEVYITNVVKCRPPKNRTPNPDEVAACSHHLQKQIALLKPRIVVCLGSLATQALIDPQARVSAVRGRWFTKDGLQMMATFHPAALLRDPSRKRPVWEDIQKIRDAYRLHS